MFEYSNGFIFLNASFFMFNGQHQNPVRPQLTNQEKTDHLRETRIKNTNRKFIEVNIQ